MTGGWASGIHCDLPARAERTERHDLDLRPGELLAMTTRHGPIEVRVLDGEPSLEATLTLAGRTAAEAESALRMFQVVVQRTGSGVEIAVEGGPFAFRDRGSLIKLWPTVRLVAHVPETTRVDLGSGSGSIVAEGPFHGCTVETGRGSVEIESVTGNVSAVSKSGRVRVVGVRNGDVFAKSGVGPVLLREIEGDRIEAIAGSGKVELTAVQGNEIRATSSYGGITGRQVRGSFDAKTSSGNIRLVDARGGTFDLVSGYGTIHVDNVTGALSVKSSSGDVRARGVTGAVVAQTGYGLVDISGTLSTVRAKSISGRVRVQAGAGSAAQGRWELSSGHGNLVLAIPPSFTCELSARTSHGRVECDFPMLARPGPSSPRELRGTIGPGGADVRLTTASGDVAIRKTE